jgi:tRNA pseudouridine38-40 synthase
LRLSFTIAYDGSAFYGSQEQNRDPHLPTVSGTVKRALEEINITSRPIFSSRTDRGVHSTGQVFHLDTPPHWRGRVDRLLQILNRSSGDGIEFRRAKEVDRSFHSRYSAVSRTYHYLISTSTPNPFQSRYVTFWRSFDSEKVYDALQQFKGDFDWRGFSKSGGGTESYRRVVSEVSLHHHKGLHILRFKANGFVRSQIRLIVGAINEYQNGKITLNQIEEQLQGAGEVIHTRKIALPNGLYLTKVSY